MEDRRLLVLYGSQTGTAQAVAERIGREGKRLHFDTVVSSMDNYQPISQLVEEKLAALVCATTGQGDQPDNMVKFWRFLLRRNLPKDSLSNLHFGVLGLGDSGYAQFNYASKRLQRRLGQLGGTSIVPLGLADDQHDLGADAVTDSWIESFWQKTRELYPLPANVLPIPADALPPPKYAVRMADSGPAINGGHLEAAGHSRPNSAKLISNNRVTAEGHFQDTRLVRLDVSGCAAIDPFVPGDVCMVQPSNLEETVEDFLRLVDHLDPDRWFSLEQNDANMELPPDTIGLGKVTNLRQCATHLFDLQAIPGRYFFELLSKFTKDDLEKEKFVEFTTAEGQQDLYEYCNRPRRNILEVLYDFSANTTKHLPLEYLFDLFPVIKPRAFSIASSPVVDTDEIHLLVAVVKYRSKLVKPRLGLCSNWLARAQPGDDVTMWVKKGTFTFPQDPVTPVVLVGPGTGLAPFRSLIRDELMRPLPSGRPISLFFGCRSASKDFYFGQDWKELETTYRGQFHLFTAFSRDQEDKIYVQHVMAQNDEHVFRLIHDQRGSFYIAGNAKQMPDQVKDALKQVLRKYTHMDDKEADDYVQTMENEKRFQTETWS